MKKKSSTVGKIIIRLRNSEEQPIHWAIKPSHQDCENKFGCLNNINELNKLSEFSNLNVVILIPSDCVIFRCISLTHQRDFKSLSYLLEESIASDVEQLHIIILQRKEKEVAIAAIDRNLINTWLQLLNSFGISLDILIPDIMALPLFNDGWSAVKLDEQWLIRKDLVSGFLINAIDFKKIIPHIIQPTIINTYSTPEINNIEWIYHSSVEPILLLANNIELVEFNFLQGEFISERKKEKYINTMIKFFVMAIFIFTLIFSIIFIDGYKIHQRAKHLNNEIFKYYQRINPSATKIVDVNIEIEKYLFDLRKITSGSLFLQYITIINSDLLQEPRVNITKINFNQDKKNLFIQFISSDENILTKLNAEFRDGFEVKKDNYDMFSLSISNESVLYDK